MKWSVEGYIPSHLDDGSRALSHDDRSIRAAGGFTCFLSHMKMGGEREPGAYCSRMHSHFRLRNAVMMKLLLQSYSQFHGCGTVIHDHYTVGISAI